MYSMEPTLCPVNDIMVLVVETLEIESVGQNTEVFIT
jgi:hypothetical protein